MNNVCEDDRFELIAKARTKLLEGTNIESAPEEMAVLNDILFRCWQIGLLDHLRYDGLSLNDGSGLMVSG